MCLEYEQIDKDNGRASNRLMDVWWSDADRQDKKIYNDFKDSNNSMPIGTC